MGDPLDKADWLKLADRHLKMADRLGAAGLHDGGVFHSYHAFECFVSAGIAAGGNDPAGRPPRKLLGQNRSRHVIKFDWFVGAYKNQPVAAAAAALRAYLCGLVGPSAAENDLRNACLYLQGGQLAPWAQFDSGKYQVARREVGGLMSRYRSIL